MAERHILEGGSVHGVEHQFHCPTQCIPGHWLSRLETDLLLTEKRKHKAKYVTELVRGVARKLQGSLRCSLVEVLYPWERAAHCLLSHPLHPLFPPTNLDLKLEKRFNYMQITVWGDISLFQIDDNSGGMYFSNTQSRLCLGTRHLLSSFWQGGRSSAREAPFLLISDEGKELYNHQASGCKTAVSEVQAQDAGFISSVSLCLTVSHSFHWWFVLSCGVTVTCSSIKVIQTDVLEQHTSVTARHETRCIHPVIKLHCKTTLSNIWQKWPFP